MIGVRLSKIIEWIQGDCLADIGCDHALVCVQAIMKRKVKKAYACDIADGPLQRAKETIALFHCENTIVCLKMDGLEHLPDDVDIVVIAGMGAKTIASILDRANVRKGLHFLFSPHTDASDLRMYLVCHGYTILRERFVYEDQHYYPIMDVMYRNTHQTLSAYETLYGKNCLQEEDYSAYLYHMETKLKKLLIQIPKDKQAHIQKQFELLKSRES